MSHPLSGSAAQSTEFRVMLTSQLKPKRHRVAVVASVPETGFAFRHDSIAAACAWVSAMVQANGGRAIPLSRLAPAISRASLPACDGATAFGFEWRRA